jgi:UDP-N-acetylmuramoyl-L-alanyl-D-glutamate--2,6-diaminopimelate ligase
MKPLSGLISSLRGHEIHGAGDPNIRSIVMDSRQVFQGCCFVAVKGADTDGHLFIGDAILKGAVAVVCEEIPQNPDPSVIWVTVPDSAVAPGILASAFYDNPSGELVLIGVTGTNGKTTIATLLYELFIRLGYRCGLISTIRYANGAGDVAASHTTPDAPRLQQLLYEMVGNGCDYCFMEVSSHAAAQKRIAGVTFAGGIFTNLTHDHLDYHSTFAEYLKAKQSFFTMLPPSAFALTSKDDRNGMVMVQRSRARVSTYSVHGAADFHGRIIENTLDGMQMEFRGQAVWLRLTGAFNAANITAIYAAAVLMQVDEDELLRVISTLEPVEGRFQQYRDEQGVTVVVDYAHTPDALRNVLQTIKEVNHDEGQVITVVGAGGNRDFIKRPVMASVAASISNRVILTSDNPRSEDPKKILDEMEKGIVGEAIARTLTIADRKEAIKTAVMMAQPGDIILIAGKGHEKYQEINGVRYPFDDMEVVKTYLTNKS